MAALIKPAIPHILLIPVGGKFADSQYIFKKSRTDFNECTLMYKPDYFFDRFRDTSNKLFKFIVKNFDQVSSFPWCKLYTSDIDQRIQMQKQLFTMLDNADRTTGATTTTTTAENNENETDETENNETDETENNETDETENNETDETEHNENGNNQIKYYKTKNKRKLLNVIGKYRRSTDSIPILVSYQRSHSGQQRSFFWLILRCFPNELPNLNVSQQYTEIFYFLHHLYSMSSIDPRIRLSIDFNNLDINLPSISASNSFEQKIKLQEREAVGIATPIRIYPSQERVGENIFKAIKNQITDFESRYDKFKFYLVLPPRKSLRTQSLARMKTVLGDAEIHYLCTDDDDDISFLTYLTNPANKNRFKNDVIDKAINSNNKRTMYLIIQDECHWGMLLNSQADKHFINQEVLLDESLSENIYILQVSATPYNIEAIEDFRRNNIIRWDEAVRNMEPTDYQGRLELILSNKIRSQLLKSKNCMLKFEECYSSIAYLSANGNKGYLSSPELSVVCEYIVTLHYILASIQHEQNEALFSQELKQFVTEETQEILRELCKVQKNGEGYLAVLRLNTVATAKRLRCSLKKLLKLYNQPDLFDIIVDADDEEDCLYDHLSKASKEKYKIWWNKPNGLIEKEKEDFGYDNLKYLPLLLIVIEKGRMGDTFPSESFRYFDLRARYQKDIVYSTYYCSLLQDVGRAFGYSNANNERPTVFMGKKIFDLLNTNKLQPHETLKKNKETTTDLPISIYIDLDKFWMVNESHPFGLKAEQSKREAHKNVAYRRFLLSAHPQIGKTASFLWAIHLFVDHFKKPNYESITRCQNKYLDTLYAFRAMDSVDLHRKLLENERFQEWNQFHQNAASIYDMWEKEPEEIVPVQKCIKIIEDITIIKKLAKTDDIVIIDMGCGLAKLAQHFKPVDNVKVISIDHRRHPLVPSNINVLEIDMKNVTLEIIGNKLAHFVVFSLSLWGSAKNIADYIHMATELSKLNGYIILIDAKNNMVNNNTLESYVISLLNKEARLQHRTSSDRPNSRFFCIVAERREELNF